MPGEVHVRLDRIDDAVVDGHNFDWLEPQAHAVAIYALLFSYVLIDTQARSIA